MWIITAWQCISSEVILKAFKEYCITNAMDGTEDGMLWNVSEGDGNVGVSMKKMRTLTVTTETVTLIGTGR
jgi:hypothetical protein